MSEIDYEETGVAVWCTQCGAKLANGDAARAHPKACRPRRSYWWPRIYPYSFAMIAFILGAIVGRFL